MTKRAAIYALALPDRPPGVPAYRWLYESLRGSILEGRFQPGMRLPATRDLAKQAGLSRGTVVSAFEQLKSEGYIEGTVGSGSFVNRVLPENLLQVSAHASAAPSQARQIRIYESSFARHTTLFSGYENRPTRAFRTNLPALDLFPTALWGRLMTHCVRRLSTRQMMGCDPFGHMPLREAIAEYLTASRGMRSTPAQVAIVSGVQEALDLAARMLLDPGDCSCVENPGYPGAHLTFRAYGSRVIAARMDEEGVIPGKLPKKGVKLIYVTPGHQFPTGVTMSLTRRLQLLEWAVKSGAIIFEDDYDSEYRYEGRSIPALQGLDKTGSVLYAGSFSKVLFPSLRLGYIVMPEALVERMTNMLSLTARHAPMLEQLVTAEFLRNGHFGRHLRRMREIYAERLNVLLEEGHTRLAGVLEFSQIEAGLQTTAWLSNGMGAEQVAADAIRHGVEVTPLGRYCFGEESSNGLQFGFAAFDPREIRRGIIALQKALADH